MSTISFFGTLVDTLKRHYELPEISDIVALPSVRSHTGETESVYRVMTETGSYVLRPFRTEVSGAIELHNQFLLWCEESDWPLTQRLVQTHKCANFFEAEGKIWWLSSYLEADASFDWTNPAWSAESCRQSGRALFLLHEALRTFDEQNCRSVTTADQSQRLRFSACQNLENQLSDLILPQSRYFEPLQEVLPLVSSAVAQVENSDLSTQLIHGDFHPGNVLFRDGAVVAIIDFEYLVAGSPIYDLAYALVMFCFAWSAVESKLERDTSSNRSSEFQNGSDSAVVETVPDGALNHEYLQSFLTGYLADTSRSQSPLQCQFQWQLLSPFMIIAAAICLKWFLQRELNDRTVRHFINVVKQLEKLSTMDIVQTIGRAKS
jgi:Ser/Thr protein kinase RdoA (MazF antagonist)